MPTDIALRLLQRRTKHNRRYIMIRDKLRGMTVRAAGLTATLCLIGLTVAGQAGATCMDKAFHAGSPFKPANDVHFAPALYRFDELQGFSLRTVADEAFDHDSIVGLWEFKWAGFSVDYGTQAYHSDGTELTFSGGQNPETGDTCQGVWRKIGPSTYTLNHIAMGWTAPGAGFGTRVHLHFVIKVDPSGNKFSGVYKAAVYSVSPTDPFDESVEVAHGTGTVTATRVQPD
jgi:hypothetical protein